MNPRPVCVCFPPLPIRSRRCDAARRHAAELRVTPLRNARSIRVASENVWYPHELVSGAKQSSLTTSTWNSPVRPTSRSAADAPVFAQQRLGLGAGEIRTGAGALLSARIMRSIRAGGRGASAFAAAGQFRLRRPRARRAGYFLHPHVPGCVTPPFGNRDAGH